MRMLRKLRLGLGAVAAVFIPVALLIELPWWLVVAVVILPIPWMGLTRVGQQAWSATQVGMATIPQRLGSSSVVVVGIAGVVGVLVALLGMGAGFEATLEQTGTDDTAIVIRGGAQTEINSVVDHLSATVVSLASQVLRNARGQPIASSELVVVASLPKKSSGLDANVEIRGVGERAWELRPNIQVIAGRKLVSGMREVMVGKGARGQFAGLDLGSTVRLSGQSWTVVGTFDSRDAHNSEIWGDTAVIGSAYRRGSGTTSITVRLTDAAAFEAFKASLESDPRLKVDVKTTRDYYRHQSESLTHLIRVLGATVGFIMAIGATFGALNTMYAAVAARPREIATLRAMGFQGVPLVVSVLLETMLLAMLGGTIGAAVAWAIFDNFTASTLGGNYSQVVFAFKVSPVLLWCGMKWALAIGFIGGLFPALRAASMPVAAGLREL
jgi:putative ABC transport system permease protein